MVTLYDPEKVMEIHDYNIRMEGFKEGREEGREKGISAVVTTLQKFNVEKSVVVQNIIKYFHLPSHIVEEKVERYWKQ